MHMNTQHPREADVVTPSDKETGHLEREWHILDLNPGPSTPKPTFSSLSSSSSPQELYRLLGKQGMGISIYTRGPQTAARRPNSTHHLFLPMS